MSSLNPAISSVTGDAQTSESAPVSISTGADRGLIVPFIADMYVDASGTVGTLQEVAVTMTGIDQIFNVTLTDISDCVHILNSFVVAEADAGAAAGVSVGMKNKDDFHAGLLAALTGATASTVDAKTLYAYLKAESRKDTVDILSYDTLANLLEASDLLTYDIAIDASGGASNMYDAMAVETDTGAKYRQAIFKQIPQANVETYVTPSDGTIKNLEDVGGLAFLPLLKGDKMTFVFDVAVGEYALGSNVMPSSGAKIHSVINDAATGGASWASAAYASSNVNLPAGNVGALNATSTYSGEKLMFTTPSKRRVAITVQFSEGGGAFNVAGGADNLTAESVLTA